MEFKASLDTPAKVITAFVILLLAGISWRCVTTIMNPANDLKSASVMVTAFLLTAAALFFAFLLAPQKYVLTHDALVIKRPLKDAIVKLNNIAEMRLIPDNEMQMSLRTFGVGGFFGYFGRFYNSKLGNFTAYATRRSNRLLITTKNGEKIIITPDDLNIVDHMNERMAVA